VKGLKRKKAAAESARGPLEIARLPGTNGFDATPNLYDFQSAKLASRFFLTPHFAATIAALAFPTREVRS
jgi:hypothetical protein